MKKLLITALVALVAQPGFAATNLGFESGTTEGWTSSGSTAATTGIGVFTPLLGNWFGVAYSGAADTYVTLSQTFTLAAGQTLRGFWGFQTIDYMPYNDDGYLSINGVNLLSSDVAAVGDGGSTGWLSFSFKAPTTGSYTLEAGVRNLFDDQFQSFVVLDAVVPEPATWALMIAGFGMVGFASRRRRSTAMVAG